MRSSFLPFLPAFFVLGLFLQNYFSNLNLNLKWLQLFSISLIFSLIHSLFFFFIFSLNKIKHKTILDEPVSVSMLFSSCVARFILSSIAVDFSPLHLLVWLLLSIDCSSSLKYFGEINGPQSYVIILNLFCFQLGILWGNWKGEEEQQPSAFYQRGTNS